METTKLTSYLTSLATLILAAAFPLLGQDLGLLKHKRGDYSPARAHVPGNHNATVKLYDGNHTYPQPKSTIHRAAEVPAPKVTLCALKTYDADWTGSGQPGVYTIEAKVGGEVKLLKNLNIAANVVAAVKSGGSMYCISTENNGTNAYFFTLNTDKWTMTGSKSEISIDDVPSDLTADPVSGKVYGAVYYEDTETWDSGFIGFGEFSLSSHSFNIKKVLERDIYALAADNKGKVHLMFGTRTGWIEPKTLKWDTGLSGVHNAYYPEGYNTMTYDETTGLLYAIVSEEQMKAGVKSMHTYLVSIDPVSFAYNTIFEFPSHQNYAGLYVMPATVDREAPKGVTDLSVNFPTIASLEGTVSFTAPTQSVKGTKLSENLSVIIQVGDTEYAIKDIAPGSKVTSPAYTFPYGKQTIKVTTANSADRGECVEIEAFAGEDLPAAVTSLTLDTDGEHPMITWEAPATGANGGKIDPSSLRYKVTRQPDNTELVTDLTATQYVDEAYTPALEAISYVVTPKTSAGYGEPASTSKAVLGGEWTVPVTESFDSQDDFDLWTIVNANGGATWQYSAADKTVQYKYDDINRLPGDDWLISPAIRLEAGKKYTLSYEYRGLYSGMKESFDVALGTSLKPEHMTTQLASHTDVGTGKKRNSLLFTVPSDGKYHLGVHATSPAYQYILEIDNITIDLLQGSAPAAATDMTVTPADRGALSATVQLSLPQTDVDGNQLAGDLSVSVTRSGSTTPVYTDSSLTPGAIVSFTDNVDKSAVYDYSATVTNLAGSGPEAIASAFIGTDVPDAVENLIITEDAEGHPSLSWSAPTKGRNGGWFDSSKLTYNVYRYFGDLALIADKTTALTATDSGLDISGNQQFVSYVVTPYAGIDAGRAIESPYMLAGAPYDAPIHEGFAKADMTWYPWISVTDRPLKQAWTLDAVGQQFSCSDYDANNGLATFHSAGESEKGVGSWFESPKINLKSLSSPRLSFALYLSDSPVGNESVQPFISIEGDEYFPLCEPISRNSGNGWKLFSVALPETAIQSKWVRVAFKGVTDGIADIYLDAVSIAERPESPIRIDKIAGSSKVAVDNPTSFDIYLTNVDSEASSASTLQLTATSASAVTLHVESLNPGESRVVEGVLIFTELGEQSFTATIGTSSASHNVICVEPTMPLVTDLEANRDGASVLLNWQAPSPRGTTPDSFESYRSWAIDGIGDWTMHDLDLDETYYINAKNLLPQAPDDYPNSTAPKAWQVCDAQELCINEWPQGTPHSGQKMLMAMANVNYVNDDWAVSPRLNGEAQRISLYAKAFTSAGTPAERLQVLYSESGTEPSCFSPLHASDYLNITDGWTPLEFDLPEGTKHFALRCVSDGAFALFVDDICFYDATVPALQLRHYEVTRDGSLIATIAQPTYTDEEAPTTKCTYGVRAIFDNGTSGEATVSVTDQSGIHTITTDDEDTDIFTTTGLRVGTTATLDQLPKGIYITRKNKVVK